MNNRFDIIVIGGGPGGYVAALEAAGLGRSVALVEAREVGGTCLNRGCIPTKALLRASGLYRECVESGGLGITAQAGYSMEAMHSRVGEVTAQLRGGIEALLARAKVTLLRGHGVIERAGAVSVGDELYEAESIIIAAGSAPARPPIAGVELDGVVTSDELLCGGVDCKSLVIIGGGVVGVEFAQIYNDLGCAVTVLEAMPRLLPPLDRELSQNLGMLFKKRGIEIHTGAMVKEIAEGKGGLVCRYTEKDTEREVSAECVLVCTGRVANTKGLWAAGLDFKSERGFIPVDKDGRTAVEGVYAIGDAVLGGVQLAHAAEAAGKNVARFICGEPCAKDVSVIPSCVFTRPEIATAGMTADEAKAAGLAVTVTKNLTSANGKSVVEGAERGFAKLVAESDSGRLLGAQLMCPHASEMIGGIAAAIVNGLTLKQLEATVFPHPTVSEIIPG